MIPFRPTISETFDAVVDGETVEVSRKNPGAQDFLASHPQVADTLRRVGRLGQSTIGAAKAEKIAEPLYANIGN